MATYQIDGASRTTGAPVSVTLRAETVADAERQAVEMGVLIGRIRVEADAPDPAAHTRDPQGEPMQIEQTSKRIKSLMACGVGMMLIGLCIAAVVHAAVGFSVAALGAAIYLRARATAWWRHG